jgi:hypothetical protein
MAACNRSYGVLGVGMVSIVSPLHGGSTMTPYNGFVFPLLPLLPPQDVPKDQEKRFNGLSANLQTRYRDETLVDMVIQERLENPSLLFRHASPRYLHRN